MNEFFIEGGWGMYPTLAFGAVLLAAAGWYAVRPERRIVPLLAALGIVTMSAGLLGFATGLRATCHYVTAVEQRPALAIAGFGESLANVVLALALVTMAALAACLGAWRLARVRPARA